MKRTHRVRYYYPDPDPDHEGKVAATESAAMGRKAATSAVEKIQTGPRKRSRKPISSANQTSIDVGPAPDRREQIRHRGLVDIEITNAAKPTSIKHSARFVPNPEPEPIKQTQLSPEMKAALKRIKRAGGEMLRSKLQKAMRLHTATVSRMIARLVARRLVSKAGAPRDPTIRLVNR